MAVHPAAVSNSFLRHFIFWGLFLPLLSMILVLLVWPDQSIQKAEVAMVNDLGGDVVGLNHQTDRAFKRWFVDTKVVSATETFFAGKATLKAAKEGTKVSSQWIYGVWMMVYRAIWRLKALSTVFFVPVLCLAVPALVDGLAVRARKQYDWQSDNPAVFYSSTHAVTVAVGLFVCLPFLPVTLTANLLAGLLVLFTFAIWFAAANFQ
jgi:hypothetical protein